MKKNNVFLITLIFLLFNCLDILANNIETDWMIFQQPNGIKFIGRGQGDEYEFYFETKEGYRFVKNYGTGFWCYAVLSKRMHSAKYILACGDRGRWT